MAKNKLNKVSIVMGSQSDYKTMIFCQNILKKLNIKFESKIISAHRTPNRMYEFAVNAEKNGIAVIIAGAGGSAHLPGMISALTSLPVLGVPIESKKLKGLDSLLSIAQMPKGIPVGTLAIGEDGAINAALLAASIIGLSDLTVKNKLNKVSIVMGSQSDYKTMIFCQNILKKLNIKFETKIISAHRTPKRMYDFAINAEKNGIAVIIAGAGGSAHLPGMISALTSLPVLGVPIESKKLKGLDSLLSIAQMPKGIPVGTLAIGEDGAINAALLAASIIGLSDLTVKKKLNQFRLSQSKSVKKKPK